jgi:prevent-host-death family protein
MKKTIHTVNIQEAKTQLSKLVDRAANGEPFIIAKAGKPLVKVTAIDAPAQSQIRRLGFMEGQFAVPNDFDRMHNADRSIKDGCPILRVFAKGGINWSSGIHRPGESLLYLTANVGRLR